MSIFIADPFGSKLMADCLPEAEKKSCARLLTARLDESKRVQR
jgi:hypothetical protein